MRPFSQPEPDILAGVESVMKNIPADTDLLLPGSAPAIVSMLSGYGADLFLVFGFNWRLPREVLELPSLGVLNVHPSALPRYRGPSPVLWAIRNGDPAMRITVHRMNEVIDAGPILAQSCDLQIPDQVTSADVWEQTKEVLADTLEDALTRATRGDPGIPQDDAQATYAGFPPEDWFELTWRQDRKSTHNQVRVLRYLNGGEGPAAEVNGRRIRIGRTSLLPAGDMCVQCADGPLWIPSWDAVAP
jgi:methionyl-tRNA formyltransferase